MNPDDLGSPNAFDTLHWAFPKALKDAGKEHLIREWMKKQFDTRYVRSRFAGPIEFREARERFFAAVDRGFVQFFE